MKQALCALNLVALLLAGPAIARAESTAEVGEAAEQLVEALTKLGVAVTTSVLRELGAAAKEHVEGEVWHGPAIESDELVGGFNLKLYPKGKSQSDEHIKAESFYRLDQDGGLKEFEFSFRP